MRSTGARRALLWLGAMALVAAIALVRKPDYHPRYLYPLLGVWFMAIGGGARALARRFGVAGWLPLAALVALWVPALAGYYTDPAERKTDYRRLVAEVLETAPADQSRLFLDGPSSGLTERYVPAGADLKIENLQSDKNTELRADDPAAFEARVDDLARRRPHLWLATDGAAEDWADGWLTENAFPVASVGVGDVTLERWFTTAPEPSVVRGPVDDLDRMVSGMFSAPDGFDPFSGDPLVVGAEHTFPRRSATHPGEVAAVTLTWRPLPAGSPWAAAPALRPQRLSIRVVDASGSIVASVDRDPVAGTRPTTSWRAGDGIVDRHGLLVPLDTPPGAYNISVVMYDAATLAPTYTWSNVTHLVVEADR